MKKILLTVVLGVAVGAVAQSTTPPAQGQSATPPAQAGTGQTAAPVFKEIAEHSANYLNIHPENGLEGPVPDSVVPPVNNKSPKTAANWPP